MLLENDLYPQDVRVRDEARSLQRAGYEVSVIAPRGADQARRETIDGIAVERFWLPMEHAGGIAGLLVEYAVAHAQLYVRAMRALLRGADVLHLHNPPDTLFVPVLAGRLLGRRAVFDQHDLFPDLVAAKFGQRVLTHVARAAQRASIRTANLVVATNEVQRQLAADTEGGSAESTIVVRNGPLRSTLDRESTLRSGALRDPHLVYVGVLETQDGVETLPGLLSSLIHDHGLDGATLTVVGWGSQSGPLKSRLVERGVSEQAVLTGRVEHDRVYEIVATADICIDPAPCDEFNHRTTMVKISEYLALGRPTVSYALRETMNTAGDAAWYARCGDTEHFVELIARLAGDHDARQTLSRRARTRAGELVWERSEAALIEGYGRLIRQA